MKLFAILNRGELVAISEDKRTVEKYKEAKGLGANYVITTIKGRVADQVMIHYEDLYLEHDEKLDMVLTRMESSVLDMIIGDEKSRISSTIIDLKHYLRNYKLSKKEKSVLKKALSIIRSSKKTRRLRKIIKLDDFLDHFGFSSIQKKLAETREKFFIFINKE